MNNVSFFKNRNYISESKVKENKNICHISFHKFNKFKKKILTT